MKIGETKRLRHPEMGEEVEVSIPHHHSFVDMNHSYPPPSDIQYLKPIHIDMKPGDCVYVPVYWWHQIEALYAKALPKNASEEEKEQYKE